MPASASRQILQADIAPALAAVDDAQTLARRLRQAMGCFATGVTIVTCRTAEGVFGFTANSFQSVSLAPPIVSFCIARNAWSLVAYQQASGFGISVLGAHQQALAERFARRGEDKWRDVRFASGHGGAPVLEDAIATFECTPCVQIEAGDHLMFLARVEKVCHLDEPVPLLFFRGRFSAGPLPPAPADRSVSPTL